MRSAGRAPDGGVLSVAQGASKLFAQVDRHGDVTATLTAAGAVSSSKAYDSYGVVAASAGSTAPSVGFQGDYTDPASGLVNMGARWYQPSSGGFVSRDTYSGRLDSPVSLNRYTYANNNPLAMFDPTGHYGVRVDGGGSSRPKPKASAGEDARDRRAAVAAKARAAQLTSPSEDARDRLKAQQQVTTAIRNGCIARGDQCKTDYNDQSAFASQALSLALQSGGYAAAQKKYFPVPQPPPPPGAGDFSNSDGVVPVYSASAGYLAAVGNDGTDLAQVLGVVDASAAAAVPGGLWEQLGEIGYSYFQKLNFFYWMHRLVQADIVSRVPGAEMEWDCQAVPGRRNSPRADVCRSILDEYGEVKPIGRGLQGVEQLDNFFNSRLLASGQQGFPAVGGDWPSTGSIRIPLTSIGVSYQASAYPGVYEWEFSGGPLPVWADFKAFERGRVREFTTNAVPVSSTNWNPPHLPGWVPAAVLGVLKAGSEFLRGAPNA